MTKNELRHIMNQLDLFNLREQVFKLYRVSMPRPTIDPPHEILMRAHYTYMEDPFFEKDIQQLRKDHEQFMSLLLENYTFCNHLEQLYSTDRQKKSSSCSN